jgi:hypothetical protein
MSTHTNFVCVGYKKIKLYFFKNIIIRVFFLLFSISVNNKKNLNCNFIFESQNMEILCI